eukprot:3021881-Alexandrium_andersonii.AAC.1
MPPTAPRSRSPHGGTCPGSPERPALWLGGRRDRSQPCRLARPPPLPSLARPTASPPKAHA